MNEFVKKNKALFKFYYIAFLISGWLLLILGISSFGITIILARSLGPRLYSIIIMNTPFKGSIAFGLFGLGIAQLLRCFYDHDYKAGFILRHAGKFIFTYLVLILIIVIIRNVYTIKYFMAEDIKNAELLYFSTSLVSGVLFAAKALILIGTAQIVKRSLPIIAESKTLV